MGLCKSCGGLPAWPPQVPVPKELLSGSQRELCMGFVHVQPAGNARQPRYFAPGKGKKKKNVMFSSH